jgi:branched-chain amino acid transport system substrate-binding protein
MLKILLVLGDQTGEDIIPIQENDIINDFWLKENRFLVKTETIPNPTIDEFRDKIAELFHVLIIIGHSSANSNGLDGEIRINSLKNQQNSISITEFVTPFRQSGLKLVILAGCSSDAAGRRLVSREIEIPSVITFNRPIYYGIAKVFSRDLLKYWIGKSLSLEMAMAEAIPSLYQFNRHYPSAESTPVFLTSIKASQQPSLMFSELAQSSTWGKTWWSLISIPLIKTLVNIRLNKWQKVIGFLLAGATLVFFVHYISQQNKIEKTQIIPPSSIISSIGDRVLFTDPKDPAWSSKNQIAELFENAKTQAEYTKVIAEAQKMYLGDDPESAWTMNNAQAFIDLQNDTSKELKLITIPVISDTNIENGVREVPRGAVMAQKEINKETNGKQRIVLKIFLDSSKLENTKDAIKVANKIIEEKSKYPAVLGHFDSNASAAVAELYDSKGIVMISATSSATTINEKAKNGFIFRTVPNSKQLADRLSEHIKKNEKNLTTVGLCYDSSSVAARDFKYALEHPERSEYKIKILSNLCDITKKNNDYNQIISKMKDDGAKGLILYFHLNNESIIKKMGAIASFAKSKEMKLFGSHSLDSPNLINSYGSFDGITIVTPRVRGLEFGGKFKEIHGKTFKEAFQEIYPNIEPSWRDMMAYDALKAISHGLKGTNNTSEELKNKLHSFTKTDLNGVAKTDLLFGSNGYILFSKNGDRAVAPSIAILECTNTCKFVDFQRKSSLKK